MKYPNKGGSYAREKDGSLKQVSAATKVPEVTSETPVAEASIKPKVWAKPSSDNPEGV